VNAEQGRIVAATELFRSDDLLVRRVGGFGGQTCYVTFDSYTDHRTLDRPGFGEHHFRARGIDAVHVLSRDNHWYQYPELSDALAAVASATARYDRVIAYGSSMGGFAALHYGAACGATVGIALSPQYTVDPSVVPFDRRWAEDVARINFREDALPPLNCPYIVYDPLDRHDKRHFDLSAERWPVIGIPVPHGGHPVAAYLLETDLLGALLRAVEVGPIDASAFARELRVRRRRSGHYLSVLAQRVPAHRPRQKVALAELAVATQGDNPVYHMQLASALDAAGEFDAAYAIHQRAIAMTGGGFHQRHALLLHHERRGELDMALAIAEALLREHSAVLWLPKTCDRLRRKKRHGTWIGRLAHRLFLDPLLDRLGI
jgi:hypothetical protein